MLQGVRRPVKTLKKGHTYVPTMGIGGTPLSGGLTADK